MDAILRSALHRHVPEPELIALIDQVQPCQAGIPWLGFVVYPSGLRVKARKVRQATRHLDERYAALLAGQISFAEFDATVQGWLAHVRWGDPSGGLRRHVLEPLVWPAGASLSRRR